MKISMESDSRIKIIPESDHEKEGLDALWKLVIRCDKDSKVLCPIGLTCRRQMMEQTLLYRTSDP